MKEKKKTNKKQQKQTNNIAKEIEQLSQENTKLLEEIDKLKEILSNTQSQYIGLKNDFDLFQNKIKVEEKEKEFKLLVDIFKRLLPVLNDVFVLWTNVPKQIKENKWFEWYLIIEKKLQDFLKNFNINVIPTVWNSIDEQLHEIVWVVNWNKKWQIVQEVQKWYYIKNNWEKLVILPAKVIVSN